MTSLQEHSIESLVRALAAKEPVPGGGAAAGAVAAIGIGLARMVLAYSIDKKSLAKHTDVNQADNTALEVMADRAMALADEDAVAYAVLNALWKLPEDDMEREAGWDTAVDNAIEAPMQTMALCNEALDRCEAMADRTNTMLHSDLNGAIHLLVAATHVAAENVKVNLPLIKDDARRAAIEATLPDTFA
jgi:formiminotetrahydrofolate cyclodeaminase